MEEACLMGFSGGLEQGKLVSALLNSQSAISIISERVNPKPLYGKRRYRKVKDNTL